MARFTRFFLTSTALAFLAPAAFADLTAEEVWTDWRSALEGFGYKIVGQEQSADDRVVLSGVTLAMSHAPGAGSMSIEMDQIVFEEQADGSVIIDLPSIAPVTATIPDTQGGMMRLSMDYRDTGHRLVVSGSPDNLRYDMEAETASLQTNGVEVDGEILPPETYGINVILENLTGSAISTTAGDGNRTLSHNMALGGLRYTLDAVDPVTGQKSAFTGQVQSIVSEGQIDIPPSAGMAGDLSSILTNGAEMEGEIAYAANATTVETSIDGQRSEASILSGPGKIVINSGAEGISYDVSQTGMEVDVSTTQMPLPLSFSIDQSAFKFAMPLQKSETAGDIGFGMLLEGFSLSDTIWSLFDPSAQLPRDPATIALDISGKARLLLDFLDPTELEGLAPGTPPAEIESVRINELRIEAVGTKLTGNGAFEFDNTDPNAPKPQGAVDLKLTGANALIDKLIATGLLPEQQAMGFRMMMGMFGVPASEPDTLTSKIEVNAEGHVKANGQRIR